MSWTHCEFTPEDFGGDPEGRLVRRMALEAAVKELCSAGQDAWSGFGGWCDALAACGWNVDRDNVHEQPARAAAVHNRISRALADSRSREDFFRRL